MFYYAKNSRGKIVRHSTKTHEYYTLYKHLYILLLCDVDGIGIYTLRTQFLFYNFCLYQISRVVRTRYNDTYI